jgi:hypothetical protein
MTSQPTYDYARDLGRKAAAMFPPGTEITTDHEALVIALDAGIPPEQIAADAPSVPSLAPLAAVMERLVR